MRRIILALLPILVGCTNVQNKGNDSANPGNGQLVTFHLNAPPSKVEPLLLSELADSVSYVALETTKETLTKDGIRCGDRFYTIVNKNKFLCFDKNGKLLHQVGNPGQGPEEYVNNSPSYDDFRVDNATNWVYCHAYGGRTLVYNEEGKYVKTLSGGVFDQNICFVNDYMIYLSNSNSKVVADGRNNQIVCPDIISEKEKEARKNNWKKASEINNGDYRSVFPRGVSQVIYCTSNEACYEWSILYDTLYIFQNKTIRPFCLIIPQNKSNPFVKQNNTAVEQPLIMKMHVLKEKILLNVRFYSSMEGYSANGTKDAYWVLCDLKDGSAKYYASNIVNDLDGGPDIKISDEIYCLSVEDLKNDTEIYNSYFTDGTKAKLKDQEGKFQRLLESLADDANPIIRTIHWK